jgi:hypothetical protein
MLQVYGNVLVPFPKIIRQPIIGTESVRSTYFYREYLNSSSYGFCFATVFALHFSPDF